MLRLNLILFSLQNGIYAILMDWVAFSFSPMCGVNVEYERRRIEKLKSIIFKSLLVVLSVLGFLRFLDFPAF